MLVLGPGFFFFVRACLSRPREIPHFFLVVVAVVVVVGMSRVGLPQHKSRSHLCVFWTRAERHLDGHDASSTLQLIYSEWELRQQ